MGFLFGSSKAPATAQQAPTILSAISVQTSVYGLSIPLVYGTNRISGNLIGYNDFTATAHTSAAAQASGGKGGGNGGSSNTSTTSYTYSATLQIGLCAGPIDGIGQVWQDKTLTTLAALGLSLFTGTDPQTAWSYLTSNYPSQALGYNDLAYVAGTNYQLDTNAGMQNNSFEIQGRYRFSASAGIIDANPADIVTDFLTNSDYGMGFPTANLGSLTSFSNYCVANGFFLSPVIDQQTQANQFLTDLATMTNSEWVWSGTTLKIVPRGDQTVTGNGVTYTPNVTPLFDLGDVDFIYQDSEDPVSCTRSTPADAYNSVKIEIVDRTNSYNTLPIEAKDQSAIEAYGLRQDTSLQAHAITTAAVGQQIAQLILQRDLYVRNTYTFRLGWKYGVLDPMDVVTLTDAGLGLSRQLVRIVSLEEDDNGVLTFTAEQLDVGVAGPAIYASSTGTSGAPNFNAIPPSVNAPIFLEPPDALAGGLQVWIVASGLANWGGADVLVSTDGSTYKKLPGRIIGSARQGVLSASLASGTALDSTHTLSVDLTESSGTLLSGTSSDATNLVTICYVDGEYIAYQTATLTGSSKYDLTTLVRGAYGSTIGAHAKGSAFARLDQAVFPYSFSQDQIGTTIYVKFTSFNTLGLAQQAQSAVVAYPYKLLGSALSSALPNITNLTTVFIAGLTQLQWSPVVDFRTVDYEIRQGPAFPSAQIIGRTPNTNFVLQGGDGTYWVTAHSEPVDGLVAYSATPASVVLAGATLVRNVLATFDEAATGWGGTLSGNVTIAGANLETTSAGNILGVTDFLGTPDILFFGGANVTGNYTVPAGHVVNVGRVAACFITIGITAIGQGIAQNVLTIPDFLGYADLFEVALFANITVQPQVAVAQADAVFGAFQNWQAGQYRGQYFKTRLIVTSTDPQTQAIVSGFTWSVDMPDRVDKFTNLAISSGGTSITYASGTQGNPTANFNILPNVQVTILNAAAGDDMLLTGQSVAGFTVQVVNGGSGVARNVNVNAQGY